MLSDGGYVDGSWTVTVRVEDLDMDMKVRVQGELHIGGLLRKLVEECCQQEEQQQAFPMLNPAPASTLRRNWSDHGLYWVEKRQWLLHYRSTLDQYGIQADSTLRFLRMHNSVVVQLPDLQTREFQVNFSKSVFALVAQICKELGLRHGEELSLARPFPVRRSSGSANRRRVNSIDHNATNRQYFTLNPYESPLTSPHQSNKLSLTNLTSVPNSPLPPDITYSPYSTTTHNQPPTFSRFPSNTPTEKSTTPYSTTTRTGHFTNGTYNNRGEMSPIYEPSTNGFHTNLLEQEPDQAYLTLPRNGDWRGSNNGSRFGGYALQSSPQSPSFCTTSRDGTLSRQRRYNSVDLHCPLTPTLSMLHNNNFPGCTEEELSDSPLVGLLEGLEKHGVPQLRTHLLRARATGLWLDSSKSLLEQGIEPHIYQGAMPFLLLRFKYYNFYDLTVKDNNIRINQLFHQARWSILSEDLDTTEEESIWFATLQYHLSLLKVLGTSTSRTALHAMSVDSLSSLKHNSSPHALLEEVDEMLDDLVRTLDNGTKTNGNARNTLIKFGDTRAYMGDWVKCHKTGKLSLSVYKKYWLVMENGGTVIECYRSKEAAEQGLVEPFETWSLQHCRIQSDTRLQSNRFVIRISFPHGVAPGEVKLKFSKEEIFSRWLQACQRAAMTLDTSDGITKLNSVVQPPSLMRHGTSSQFKIVTSASSLTQVTNDGGTTVDWRDFVSPKYFKRLGTRLIRHKVMETYSRVQHLSPVECKMEYVRAWQRLPSYGLSYFMVRQRNSKREDFLCISATRMLLLDYNSKQVKRSWLFSELKTWNVNWQVQEVVLHLAKETFAFTPMFCSCKSVHEFIGGYICLALRTPEKNQNLDEATFRKFTSDMCSISA